MKALLVLAALLVSNFAQANTGMRSIDCDKGDDAHGGKFCHYEISQCTSNSCEEAVKCMVKKVSSYFGGDEVTVYIADIAADQVVRNGEVRSRYMVQSHKNDCNGRQCLTPMIVYTGIRSQEVADQKGMCEAVALQLVGAQ